MEFSDVGSESSPPKRRVDQDADAFCAASDDDEQHASQRDTPGVAEEQEADALQVKTSSADLQQRHYPNPYLGSASAAKRPPKSRNAWGPTQRSTATHEGTAVERTHGQGAAATTAGGTPNSARPVEEMVAVPSIPDGSVASRTRNVYGGNVRRPLLGGQPPGALKKGTGLGSARSNQQAQRNSARPLRNVVTIEESPMRAPPPQRGAGATANNNDVTPDRGTSHTRSTDDSEYSENSALRNPQLTEEEKAALLEQLEQAMAEKAVLLEGYNADRKSTKVLEQKVKKQTQLLQLTNAELAKHSSRVKNLRTVYQKQSREAEGAEAVNEQLTSTSSEYQDLKWRYGALEQEIKLKISSKMTGKKKLIQEVRKQRTEGQQKNKAGLEKKNAALQREVKELLQQRDAMLQGGLPATVLRQRKQVEIAEELAKVEEDLQKRKRQELQQLQDEIAQRDRDSQRALEVLTQKEDKARHGYHSQLAVAEATKQAKLKEASDLRAAHERQDKELAAKLELKAKRSEELQRVLDLEKQLLKDVEEEDKALRQIHKAIDAEVHSTAKAEDPVTVFKRRWANEKSELQKNLQAQHAKVQSLEQAKKDANRKVVSTRERTQVALQEAGKKDKAEAAQQDLVNARRQDLEALKLQLNAAKADLKDAQGKVGASQKDKIIAKLSQEEEGLKNECHKMENSNQDLKKRTDKLTAALKKAGISVDDI